MNLPSLKGNWVDFVILVVFLYFLSDAWRTGFWIVLADFLGFLVSIVTALFGYSFVSSLFQSNFSFSRSLSNAIGFLLIAALCQMIISFVFINIIRKIPYKFWKQPWSSIVASFPAIGQGIVFISFILTLAMSLPIFPKVKTDINESAMGGYLLEKTSWFDAKVNNIFGGLIEESLTYLTVYPGSHESLDLRVDSFVLTIDEVSENQMLGLVNKERKKQGINELAVREEPIPVARSHAQDMWQRAYFGHYSPEGEDVSTRLKKAEVNYFVAGENLALAPTVQTAHTGLMNSEGHKKNILDPEFKRVGIGVIDNGVYGKMFVQIFTD
ncbi:CvpA family protein [Patescibacteria group bacterium]